MKFLPSLLLLPLSLILLLPLPAMEIPEFVPPVRDELAGITPAMAALDHAMTLVQERRLREAIPMLEGVLAEDPSLLSAWETLGWALWLDDQREAAETLWNRLVTIAPDEPTGYNLLAQVATANGNLRLARERYETSLRLDPAQFEIRVAYARVLLWSGDHPTAVRELRRLSREAPDRLDVRIDLAWAMYANEDYEASLDIWNGINDMMPDDPGFLMARANVLLLIGALPEAEADARATLEAEPENREAVLMLADLAERSGTPEQVVRAMRRVIDLLETERDQARVATRLANFMFGVHQREPGIFSLQDCIRAAREAVDLDPDEINAVLFLGELLLANRQFSSAAEQFQHVLDTMNPHNIRALYGMMETYFGRAQFDNAETQLIHNLRLFNPENPYRHVFWARLHFARGNYPDALRALEDLEMEGARGAIFHIHYTDISPSEWSDTHSARQLRDHLITLRRAGFRFVSPSEIPAVLESQTPPALRDGRTRLQRGILSARSAWAGNREADPVLLRDHVPPKIVAVSFDGGFRNAFRFGTQIAEEMMIPLGMFLRVGDVVDLNQNRMATFAEIQEFLASERWEIHSQLWEAGRLATPEAGGREVRPLPHLIWNPLAERQETFREYHQRLRREFRTSRNTIVRELNLGEDDVRAVAYPFGDIGQESTTNISLFNVTDAILNEAELTYRIGFLNADQGYAIRRDNPMLSKRWQPGRFDDGREVLRQSYLQHPVFMARRMRAELAALKGELHTANEAVTLLRRDGFPEEDLAELQAFVDRHLARLMPLPESVDADTAAAEDRGGLIRIRQPFVGIDARTTRANEQIEDWDAGLFAGANLNRSTVLQLRASVGSIRQTVTTNFLFETERTTRSTSTSTLRIVEDGVVTNRQQTETLVNTVTVESNRVERTRYQADRLTLGLHLNHVHTSGSVTLGEIRLIEMDGDEIGSEQAVTYGIEHRWRPRPALDLAARYQHGLVPSARSMIEFDALQLKPLWRFRDGWHIQADTQFQYYEDRNSLLHLELENLWRLSIEQDIWLGLHNSVTTMDRDSEFYWSPYWNERHYVFLRLRRAYPNYFAMLMGQIGIEREQVRDKQLEEFRSAQVRGETIGFFPGLNPERGWSTLVGATASVTRTWKSGWELSTEFTVRALREYIEHSVSASLLYRF